MKLLALRLLAFIVLMGFYAINPWLGIAGLVVGMGYTIGQAFFAGSHAVD